MQSWIQIGIFSHRIHLLLLLLLLYLVDKVARDVPDAAQSRPVSDVNVLEADLATNQLDELLALKHGRVQDGRLALDGLQGDSV